MGKVIKKNLNGMSWWMKTSLVLLLTLATSMFMYQGWYVPKEAKAAPVNYYLFGAATSSVGVDGSTTVIAAAASYSITQGATNSSRAITSATAPTQTATNGRIQLGATATAALTKQEMVRVYTPAYGASTTISASIVSRVDAYHRTAGAGTVLVADVFEYNNTTGFVGVAKGTGTVAIANNLTAATYSVTLNNPSFTVASGNRVVVVYYFTCASGARPAMLYGGALNTTTPTGLTSFTLNETAAPTDSTPPTAGTVTITPDISSTYTSSAPTITTQFTDAESGLVSCAYTTDGTTWLAGVTSGAISPYTCTASPTGLTSGLKNINMRATSGGGGPTTATQIQRTVDATVPTDGALTVTAGNTLNTISWTAATDAGGSGIASYILRFATGAAAPLNCASGTAVPGSPFSAATLSTSHTGLVNTTQYSYRLCATDSFNTSGGATGTGTPVTGPLVAINSCGGCHGHPAGPNALADSASRTGGTFQGNHVTHAPLTADCAKCHTNPTAYNHSDGTINMNATISGGTYAKGSVPVSNAAAFVTTNATCSNTTCHGTGATIPWSTNTTQATCTKCHGVNTTSSAQYTTQPRNAAPGYISTAPVGTGRDTAGLTAATGPQVGAHDTHLKASNLISSAIACTECHSDVITTGTAFTGHMDGNPTLSFGTIAKSGTGTAPGYNSTTGTCSSTYCHFGRSTAGPATPTANVVWSNTAYLTGVDTAAADCGKCHASPPETGTNHTGSEAIADCNGCHNHVNTSGVFTIASLHINGIVESQVTCVSCHSKVQGTRSIITGATGEFNLAYGHKKSSRTTVTDSDCIVCHLEGTWATQKANNYNATTNPTGKHKDGFIDLRDPDGAGETVIKDNQVTPVDFRFTKYAIAYTAGSRTQTLGNTIPEVVTVKFCLKCHDGNGATNPTALTRNAANTATTGTTFSPFEGVTMGTAAAYSVLNGAASAGYIVDVSKQVLSTNSSRHPVGAPNSRAYPTAARLVAPYNNIGTTRDGNTTATNTATPRNKANSVVLVCDDCHTVTTAVGAVPALLNRTISAHGNAVMMRGTYYVATPTLCISCHGGVTAASTTTGYIDSSTVAGSGDHNTGSAFTTGTTRVSAYMATCHRCHFSSYAATALARPIIASDMHGNNGLLSTGNAWTYGAANTMRPVAFLRNVTSWTSAAAGSPRPYVATGITAGASTCGNAAIGCSTDTHSGYAPGGSY